MTKETRFEKRMKRDGTKHGLKAEKKFAKRTGAMLHPGSGAVGLKGDCTLGNLKIENKCTVNASMSIKLEWLAKITREALEIDQTPALNIQFVNAQGDVRSQGSWVLLREQDFQRLIENDGD